MEPSSTPRSWPVRAAALLPILLVCALATAPARAERPIALDAKLEKADRILVLKSARLLQLLHDGRVLKSYPIALGGHPVGPKERAGDSRTPEGVYRIDGRNPHSRYFLSLHISYPSAADAARAHAAHVPPGGDIFVHGMPNAYGPYDPIRFFEDWTDGCISVGNVAIQEIWARVDDGTTIEIRP